MTGGTKVINRSLTIISLMVMIAAGSLIITIPDASADFVHGTFTIKPIDENEQVILNCEVTISSSSDPDSYQNFGSDVYGLILVDTLDMNWDLENDNEIIISPRVNNNTHIFGTVLIQITEGLYNSVMDFCGSTLIYYEPNDQHYHCSGGPRDTYYKAVWSDLPSGISYPPTSGVIYFHNLYNAHLTANGYRGYKVRMTIDWFFFTAYKGDIQTDTWWVCGNDRRDLDVVLVLDQTTEDKNDTHWDPYFIICFTRIGMPSVGWDYKLEWGAKWNIEYYREDWGVWSDWGTPGGWEDSIVWIM